MRKPFREIGRGDTDIGSDIQNDLRIDVGWQPVIRLPPRPEQDLVDQCLVARSRPIAETRALPRILMGRSRIRSGELVHEKGEGTGTEKPLHPRPEFHRAHPRKDRKCRITISGYIKGNWPFHIRDKQVSSIIGKQAIGFVPVYQQIRSIGDGSGRAGPVRSIPVPRAVRRV